MMLKRGLFAALACVAACASPASPAPDAHPLATAPPVWCGRERCTGAFYRSEGLEFGKYLIGAPVVIGPTAEVINGDCARRRAADCDFVEDRVHYFAARGRVTGMRIDMTEPPPRLPYGLRGDETLEEALAVMRGVTSIPMELSGREDGDNVVTVAGSLKNALGRPEWLDLVFSPDGRLEWIELYGPRY